MLDFTEHKPRNRSYFGCRIRAQGEKWTPIVLAATACLATMGIACFLNSR